MNSSWIDILNLVKNHEISVEEGANRLADLENGQEPGAKEPPAESVAQPVEEPVATIEEMPSSDKAALPDLGWWGRAWMFPFWIGMGIFILGAVMMAWASAGRHFFWFYCAWLPLVFGMLAFLLGWWSQRARWLHVRVQDKNGSHVAISFPLPLRLAAWVLRIFGPLIPKLKELHLTDLPLILDSLCDVEGPLTVEVDDHEEHVRVYII